MVDRSRRSSGTLERDRDPAGWAMVTSLFVPQRLTAGEALEVRLSQNPFHPFTIDERDGTLVYRRRYMSFWFGLAGVLTSLVAIVVQIGTDTWHNSYFLYAILLLILSTFTVLVNFGRAVYLIDGRRRLYRYLYGEQLVHQGKLYNLCIRLRKRVVVAGRPLFFLILFGVHIDMLILSGTSPRRIEMRRIGQHMATNLNINYFDDADISKHHRVVHFRD